MKTFSEYLENQKTECDEFLKRDNINPADKKASEKRLINLHAAKNIYEQWLSTQD